MSTFYHLLPHLLSPPKGGGRKVDGGSVYYPSTLVDGDFKTKNDHRLPFLSSKSPSTFHLPYDYFLFCGGDDFLSRKTIDFY